MPIRSMTGFGLAEHAAPSGTYRVEIRAVNNRYQEIQVRLPKFAAGLESKIKKEFATVVSRGSISIFVSCDRETETLKLTWDKSAVDSYMRIFKEIKNTHNISGDVTFADLLRFGDFIKNESVAHSEETLWKHLRPALAAAIKAFQEAREVEGAQLVKDLKKVMKDISKTLQAIEKRAPERVKEYRAALSDRVAKITSAATLEPQRIAMEVALMAERLDISEEIVRLRAHIEKFCADLTIDEPVGKRMGFLLQEMNREANTIGSKANDTQIAHFAISLKENIEKIREQIQNIE